MTALKHKDLVTEPILDNEITYTPKMKAFMKLEKMLVPTSLELDYDKELAEALDEKYGHP